MRKSGEKPTYSDAVSDAEFELYRYNIPPMYNGNSFVEYREISDEPENDGEDEASTEIGAVCNNENTENAPPLCTVPVEEENSKQHEKGLLWLPQIGSEEMMLLGIIYLLATEKCTDDSVLILAVILLAGI